MSRAPANGAAFGTSAISVAAPGDSAVAEFVAMDPGAGSHALRDFERPVVIRIGSRPQYADTHYLRRRLGITRVDADVDLLGRLMPGRGLPAIAEARGCTLEIVRGVLRALRQKRDSDQPRVVSAGWQGIGFVSSSVG